MNATILKTGEPASNPAAVSSSHHPYANDQTSADLAPHPSHRIPAITVLHLFSQRVASQRLSAPRSPNIAPHITSTSFHRSPAPRTLNAISQSPTRHPHHPRSSAHSKLHISHTLFVVTSRTRAPYCIFERPRDLWPYNGWNASSTPYRVPVTLL